MQVQLQKKPTANEPLQGKSKFKASIRRVASALGVVAALVLMWRVQVAVRSALNGSTAALTVSGEVLGRTSLRYAKRFTIEYRTDCKVIRVADPSNADKQTAVYQLVPRGHRPTRIEQGAQLVETPVRRAIALSTTNALAFLQLGVPEVLVGVAGVKMLTTPELVAQAARGQLAEVSDGTLSMNKPLDFERIRTLAPDIILTSYRGNDGSKLEEAGFKVAENSEWLEPTPLGRAEWIKFIAAFLDRETEAETLFSGIEQRYDAQVARARAVTRRPTVMYGHDQRGTWFVAGGQSYVATFIQHAGGQYLWGTDSSTGSVPLKMEAVLERARDAEFWLLHMSSIRSRRELSELDPRNELFAAFRSGRVFSNDARLSLGGGNDYWETGVTNPDLVLADMIALLHPEIAPNHQFIWYRQLPEEAKH
jgi:iron complex transport system substrate-binding protein